MLSHRDILKNLDAVTLPGGHSSLLSLNLVRKLDLGDGRVSLTLADTGLRPEEKDLLRRLVRKAIGKRSSLKKLDVAFEETKPIDINKVQRVIAVMSGKGGVGKSLVSGLFAVFLRRDGCNVGILDADISGPSIPRMFGISGPLPGIGHAIVPIESKSGIKIVSMNLLLENESDPVIWRGPIISNAIKQFWEETLWGNLDYLVIDLPPGTTDATLTVMQSLPVTGIVVVSTPQNLVEMIVKKAVNMAKAMDKPIIGIVENMSYLVLPDTDKKMDVFGTSHAEEIAREIGAPLLGRLPIDPEIVRLCDEGGIELYSSSFVQALGESLSHAVTGKQETKR